MTQSYMGQLTEGLWQDYTPGFTNFSLGNGTINLATYVRIGDLVVVRFTVTLGSTSSVSGAISMDLPVDAAAASTNSAIGFVRLIESGGGHYAGAIRFGSASLAQLQAIAAGGTYASYSATSSTIPFTWGTSDVFTGELIYEAA